MEAQTAAASRPYEFYVDRPIYIVLVKARAKHAAEGYRGEASEPVTFATTLLGSTRRRRGIRPPVLLESRDAPKHTERFDCASRGDGSTIERFPSKLLDNL